MLSLQIANELPAQLFVAHRGASFDAPENTLAAFRLAWEQNADAIEGDFLLTADQQIVCIHDQDTERVCPTQPPLKVVDTDLATLRQLDVGSWKDEKFAGERMPTLAEVLATVPPDKQIFVEIKTGPEILPALKQQLTQSSLKPDQITLICFDTTVIKQAREMMPQYRANWLTGYEESSDAAVEMDWSPSREQVLKTLADTGATGLGSQENDVVIDQDFVTAVLDAGLEFHVWTVDDPIAARRLKNFGVMSLTTNRPEFLRTRLQK